jgi:hypothetical protein
MISDIPAKFRKGHLPHMNLKLNCFASPVSISNIFNTVANRTSQHDRKRQYAKDKPSLMYTDTCLRHDRCEIFKGFVIETVNKFYMRVSVIKTANKIYGRVLVSKTVNKFGKELQ